MKHTNIIALKMTEMNIKQYQKLYQQKKSSGQNVDSSTSVTVVLLFFTKQRCHSCSFYVQLECQVTLSESWWSAPLKKNFSISMWQYESCNINKFHERKYQLPWIIKGCYLILELIIFSVQWIFSLTWIHIIHYALT